MSQYLFLFTIGPVQSFISQARKTQDLYAGSFLLSDLINSTMNKLEELVNNNCEFIFPSKIDSKPNRFIAEIESNDIEKLGKDLKNFVENKFEKISTSILEELHLDSPAGFKPQIKDFLQVNWVALPLEKDNYEATYKELESYLGSIKNVRGFGQLEEAGRKCSLCGERNVLFYRLTDKERKNGGLKVRKDGLLKKIYAKRKDVVFYEPEERDNLKMQKGEGFCAVCFTKRFADKYQNYKNKYEKNYPSTVKIALMDLLTKLDSGLLSGYRDIFGKNFDEELYYEDSLTERYFKKNNYPVEKLKDAKEYYRKISERARENKVTFSRYYAILVLDGDSMGRWLSGEFLEKKTKLKEFHKVLSKKLGNYAKYVSNIIKEPKGKLVYAGGDDVLVFINMNQLLPVMEYLREKFPKFEEIVNTDGQKMVKDGEKSSASAGVVIAHYKTPLSEALKRAREMEHEAKEKGGRDAFATAALKRSGEINKTIFKWQYGDSSSIEILDCLIKSLKPKEDSKQADFSNTFIKNLGFEFRRLVNKEGKYKEPAIFKTELKRLVKRSCTMTREEGETREDFKSKKKQAIADLTKKLDTLYTNSKSLDNFLSALNIADFIKRGGQLK